MFNKLTMPAENPITFLDICSHSVLYMDTPNDIKQYIKHGSITQRDLADSLMFLIYRRAAVDKFEVVAVFAGVDFFKLYWRLVSLVFKLGLLDYVKVLVEKVGIDKSVVCNGLDNSPFSEAVLNHQQHVVDYILGVFNHL